MHQRLRVFELARELGVSIVLVIRVAEHLKLPVRRGVAQLTPRQEALIREELARGGWRSRKRRPDDDGAKVSNSPASVRSASCECCELLFTFRLQAAEKPRWCQDCAGHYEIAGESQDRVMARYSDHEQRVRKWYRHASRRATEYEARMKSAFESRQKWKAALVEVAICHEPTDDGKCICGASESPCATMRMLEHVNRGIARQVEKLASLSREELDQELYPNEPWHIDLRFDDDPLTSAATSDDPAA